MRSPACRRTVAASAVAGVLLVLAAPASATPFAHHFTSGPGRAAAPAPAVTSAARTATFAGTTVPDLAPVVMDVGRSRIARIATMYKTDSFAYASVLGSKALRRATVNRKGRFSFTATTVLVDNPRVYWSGDSYPLKISERFTGKVVKGTAIGSVRATLTFADGSKASTGMLHWLLKHSPGQVFGGVTSQSMPVSVELSADRTRINHLHVGWIAEDPAGGAWIVRDFLTNFPLTGGAVTEAFKQEFPSDDGARTTLDYQLSASVGRKTSTGALQVTITNFDPSGAVIATGTTPMVRWTGRS